MHYTNMKIVESCYISSCNLLSQRHFNGNLSLFVFSNSLPFTLQNDFSTCLILSFQTTFKGFDIFLNNFIPTWPPPHQLPIPEIAQGQETAARLRSETLAAPLEIPTALSPTLPPPGLPCPMPSCSLKLSTGNDPGHLLCHFASLAQTMWPAFAVMCIRIPYCLYVQQFISDGWLPKAFSSHMLRLLKAAKKKREKEKKKVLIRSVTFLCCLIGWSPVEPSTIKKNLSYSSCLHPIKPPTEASNTLSSLSPEWRLFLILLENFLHRTIGLTGLDFHFHPSCSKIVQLEEAKPLEREILGNRWKLNLKESKNAPFLEMREKGRNEKGKTWKCGENLRKKKVEFRH